VPETGETLTDILTEDITLEEEKLLEGINELDATDAGAGVAVGNEGHTTVVVDYLAPEAEVTSGFDTTGISLAFENSVEEYGIKLEKANEQNNESTRATPQNPENGTPTSDPEPEVQNPENPANPEPPVEPLTDDPVGHSNNGHGNNEDGTDSSNPGNSNGTGNVDHDAESGDSTDDEVNGDSSSSDEPSTPSDTLDIGDILDSGKPILQHQDNGFGNGDDDAPGNSEQNNNAENAGGNHDGTVNAPGNSNHVLDVPQYHVDVS
jgi:hypothetical protein